MQNGLTESTKGISKRTIHSHVISAKITIHSHSRPVHVYREVEENKWFFLFCLKQLSRDWIVDWFVCHTSHSSHGTHVTASKATHVAHAVHATKSSTHS